MTNLGVIVAQIGARQHYSIPLVCHKQGTLVRFHTDYWNAIPPDLAPLAGRLGGKPIRRLLGRQHDELPRHLVRSHTLPAIYWDIRLRASARRSDLFENHARWGESFARRVAASLGAEEFSTFFGFSSASLEAMRAARKLGALAVLDDIAPVHLEDEVIAEEQRRFPRLESRTEATPRRYLARLEEEWEEADRILVNSKWTREALRIRGVPEQKMHVIPIVYELSEAVGKTKMRRHDERLRVLWLGTLCLRKGFQYALEAARLLDGEPVDFTFAGPTDIDLRSISWPDNSRYVGQVARLDAKALWDSHHLFILPTLSDGFAITQLEAIAHGLPAIVTPCCGDVVEDGRSGLIVPPRNPRAVADAILRVLTGEIDLEAASLFAQTRATSFSMEALWPLHKKILSSDCRHDGVESCSEVTCGS